MTELIVGLIGWMLVALLVGVVISRFLRQPDSDALDPPTRLDYLRHLLPGYGQDEKPVAEPRQDKDSSKPITKTGGAGKAGDF